VWRLHESGGVGRGSRKGCRVREMVRGWWMMVMGGEGEVGGGH